MATLFHPYFSAAQEANIPLWALIEHAAASASTGVDGGFQQFCNAAKASGQKRTGCGRPGNAAEEKPCSSRQARAQEGQCHRRQPCQKDGEGVINFEDFLKNASAIAQSFFGPNAAQGSGRCGARSSSTPAANISGKEILTETVSTENGFEVNLNVSQYGAKELNVKTVNNSIVIEAKHDEKKEGHGFVTRSFARRYVLPEEIKVENVTCKLASNGILTLSAPIVKPTNERAIPINFTGIPATVPVPPQPTPSVEAVVAEPTEKLTEATNAPAEKDVPVAMDEETKLD